MRCSPVLFFIHSANRRQNSEYKDNLILTLHFERISFKWHNYEGYKSCYKNYAQVFRVGKILGIIDL